MDSKSNIIDIKAQNISIVPVTSLKPKQNNRNFHPDDQIQRLAELFKYQGFRNPLIVSNQSGEIVCGNGRYLAALRAGLKELPVIYQDFESAEQEYAYHVSDNAVSLWAELDLSGINTDLQDLGPDFNIDMLGIKDFTLEPLDRYDNVDADAAPDVPVEPKSKLGDLYELGNHRLLCGDSTDKATVEKLMNGEKFDLLTDPPYGINANKENLGKGKKQFYRGDDWDSSIPNFFHVLSLFNKYIIWGGNYFADKLKPTNDWLCWHKKMDNRSFSEFELAYSNLEKNCRLLSHHWSGEEKLHPTMKPVKVMEWCIDFLGNNIFDLFGGSGSTLIACEKTNRKCFMCELDPHYIQVIIERYIKFTGRDDVYLINDDGSKTKWSDISEKR